MIDYDRLGYRLDAAIRSRVKRADEGLPTFSDRIINAIKAGVPADKAVEHAFDYALHVPRKRRLADGSLYQPVPRRRKVSLTQNQKTRAYAVLTDEGLAPLKSA